jgi:hypothetical protein
MVDAPYLIPPRYTLFLMPDDFVHADTQWAKREFKLCVQTSNARQRYILRLRCKAIMCESTCCFKTSMSDYCFDIRKEI